MAVALVIPYPFMYIMLSLELWTGVLYILLYTLAKRFTKLSRMHCQLNLEFTMMTVDIGKNRKNRYEWILWQLTGPGRLEFVSVEWKRPDVGDMLVCVGFRNSRIQSSICFCWLPVYASSPQHRRRETPSRENPPLFESQRKAGYVCIFLIFSTEPNQALQSSYTAAMSPHLNQLSTLNFLICFFYGPSNQAVKPATEEFLLVNVRAPLYRCSVWK